MIVIAKKNAPSKTLFILTLPNKLTVQIMNTVLTFAHDGIIISAMAIINNQIVFIWTLVNRFAVLCTAKGRTEGI